MSCGGCGGSNFYVSPPSVNLSTTTINNIVNSAVVQQIITDQVTNIVNDTLSQTPFSIALQPGTLELNVTSTQLSFNYYPEEIGESLTSNNGLSFVWKESLFSIFNKAQVVFWTNEQNSYSDAGGFPLARPVEVRVIQSDGTKGVDYSVLQATLSTGTTGAFDNYRFQGMWDASTNTITGNPFAGFDAQLQPTPGVSGHPNSTVGYSFLVETAGIHFGKTWGVGDLIVVNQPILNGYAQITAAQVSNFLLPNSVLLLTDITTTGAQIIQFDTIPTNDSIIYVHFKSIAPTVDADEPYDNTQIHGVRVDLFF